MLSNILSTFKLNHHSIIIGDLNIDLLKLNDDEEEFSKLWYSSSFFTLISDYYIYLRISNISLLY